MSKKYLVLTDIDAIQSYVFSSVRMATIVGASQIVRQSNVELMDQALKQDAIEDECVASGGVGLFVFNHSTHAENFARAAAGIFTEHSVSGSLTVTRPFEFEDSVDGDKLQSPVPIGVSNGDSMDDDRNLESEFVKERNVAILDLENRKRLGHAKDECISNGMIWVCETCGQEPAIEIIQRSEGARWRIGRACLHKFRSCKQRGGDDIVRDQQLRYYPNDGKISENEYLQIPTDFDALCSEGYWALIVIDGDGLGDRLRGFRSPSSFANFSKKLDDLIGEAISHGLQAIRKMRPSGVAPATVLFDGGDDIVIACQGDLALSFVLEFSRFIQYDLGDLPGNAKARLWDWANSKPIGFSAGVAIVRQGFPFRTAHAIAHGLLRNAKRAAFLRGWQEGAVDYALVSESYGDAESILQERTVEDGEGQMSVVFSGRPYRLNFAGPLTLARLKEACEELVKAEFARGRLFDLRNNLTRSAWTIETNPLFTGITELLEKTLGPFLSNWHSRTCRVDDAESSWNKVQELLELNHLIVEDANACQVTDGSERYYYCFPQADLADGIYLWGSTNGN